MQTHTITDESGTTLGTVEELNNGGYIVYAPTCSCGQYGGVFPTLRAAQGWLSVDEVNYHARNRRPTP